MKRTRPSIVTVALLAVMACNKEETSVPAPALTDKTIQLTPEEYQSIAFDNPGALSDQEMSGMLEKFVSHKKVFNLPATHTVTLEKKSHLQLNDAMPDTKGAPQTNNIPVYQYAIKNSLSKDQMKDIAIVSADERYPVVLAYYKSGDTSANVGSKLLVEASMELLKDNIRKVEENKKKLRTATLEKVSGILDVKKEEISFRNIKDRIAIIGRPGTKANMVTDPSTLGAPEASYGPYLSTGWSIGMPYNRLMAQSCPNNWLWDNRYAISSVVVATAQVLAAYRPYVSLNGVAMDWAYLTVNKEIYEDSDYFGTYVQDPIERRNMVASLMKGLGEACSVNYTCSGSSVAFSNIRNYLSSKGIQTGNQQGLHVPTIKTAIENLKPVFMYGQTSSNQGHWWVVDGTYITLGNQSYLPGFNFYIHANMGQGKSYLGYYLVGTDASVTFNASFAHFSQNFQMYPITTSL